MANRSKHTTTVIRDRSTSIRLSNLLAIAIDTGNEEQAHEVRQQAEDALKHGTITIQERADIEADFDAAGFDSSFEAETRYGQVPAPTDIE